MMWENNRFIYQFDGEEGIREYYKSLIEKCLRNACEQHGFFLRHAFIMPGEPRETVGHNKFLQDSPKSRSQGIIFKDMSIGLKKDSCLFDPSRDNSPKTGATFDT